MVIYKDSPMTNSSNELSPRNDVDPVHATHEDEATSLAQRHLEQSQPEVNATPLQQTLGQAMRYAAVHAAYKEVTSKTDLPTEAIPRVTTFTQAAAESLRASYRQYKQEYKLAPTEARTTKPSRVLGRMVSRFFKK